MKKIFIFFILFINVGFLFCGPPPGYPTTISCSANEIFVPCGKCGTDICGEVNTGVCPKICLVPGDCACKEGHCRNSDNNCIAKHEARTKQFEEMLIHMSYLETIITKLVKTIKNFHKLNQI